MMEYEAIAPWETYGIHAASGPLTDTGVPQTDIGSAVVLTETLTNLSTAVPYRWRVRTFSLNPFFPRSPWISMTCNTVTEMNLRTGGVFSDVAADPELLVAASALMLRINPNPTLGATTISYRLPQDSHVEVLIFDVDGRIVRRLVDAEQTAGDQRMT